MKVLTALFLFVLAGNLAFGQKNVSQETGKEKQQPKKTENQDNQADKKSQEIQTVHIVAGSSGVKRSIGYKFSSLPEDSDPGNGIFRYNNETVSQITYIFVDDKDLTGEDQTKWYETWDDTTGATARGELIIADIEGNIITVFDVTGVFVDSEGFWKIPVKYSSGVLPADGSAYYYVFNRIAHKKNEADQSNQAGQLDTIAVQVIPADESKQVAEVPVPEQSIPAEQGIAATNVDIVEEEKPEEAVNTNAVAEVPAVEQATPIEQVTAETNVDTVEEEKPVEVINPNPPAEVPAVEQATPIEPVIAVSNVVTVAAAKPTEEAIPNPVVNTIEQTVIPPVVEVTPVEQTNPPAMEVPVTEVNTVEAVNPVVVVAPVPAGNLADQVIIPAEEAAPVIEPAKVEQALPVEKTRIDELKPEEELKPVRQARPVEEKKPVRQTRPAPAPQTKVAEQPKPVIQPKPVEQSKPIEQAQIQQTTPVEQPIHVARPKTTETGRPIQETRPALPVAQNKPVEQPKPVVQPKTTEAARPVQETRPALPIAQNRPAVQPKPAVQPQPSEQAKPNEQVNIPYQGTQSYQLQEVKSESRENQFAAIQNNSGATSGKHRKWYRGIIEVGYGLGAGDYGIDNFRFNFINGFHIGPNFSLGLGLGIRRYFVENENYTDRSLVSGKVQIPVFIDFRTTLSSRKITPYFAMGIGNSSRYAAKSDSASTVNEGLLFNSSAGIWFNISDRFAVFGGIAWEMQTMEYLKLSDDSHYKKNTGSVSLNIGISF